MWSALVVNPNAVRQALAEHGIPALVTAGSSCRMADPRPPDVQFMGMSPQPQPQSQSPVRVSGNAPAGFVGFGPFVIYGSKIPRGFELSMGYRQDPQHREISFTLIQAGAPLTCTSIPGNG